MNSFASTRPLRLGTRRSPLAMAQAEEAQARLLAAHPGLGVEIVPVTASGDKIQDRPLAEIGGKALWTKELDQWLLDGEIDFAVHSLKDVETIRPAEIVIAAVLPREDVRDVLVGAASIRALPQGAVVGTSAPRRAAQLLHARPDLKVVSFRGNVATRLAKLAAGEADATLLARAGLKGRDSIIKKSMTPTTPSLLCSSGPFLPRLPMMLWICSAGGKGSAARMCSVGCCGARAFTLSSLPLPSAA